MAGYRSAIGIRVRRVAQKPRWELPTRSILLAH